MYLSNLYQSDKKLERVDVLLYGVFSVKKETRLNACGIYYFFSFISIKKSNLNPLAKEFVMGKGREQVSILLQY